MLKLTLYKLNFTICILESKNTQILNQIITNPKLSKKKKNLLYTLVSPNNTKKPINK